jgi:uncharacterized protein YegL
MAKVEEVRSRTEKVEIEVPLKKLVFVVLDVSGSMAGGRLKKALDCVNDLILKEVCEDTDHFSLVAFANDVHTVTSRRPKYAVKWPKVAEIATSLCGGRTRLWDAVLQAMDDLKDMPRAKDVHVDLVVFTDGEDNCSQPGALQALETQIAKPGIANFHAIFLACCGAQTADMKRLASGKKHVRIIEEASNSPDAITKAFGRATRLLIERKTTTITTHTSHGAGRDNVSTRTIQTENRSGASHLRPALSNSAIQTESYSGTPRQRPANLNGGWKDSSSVPNIIKPIDPRSKLGANVFALLEREHCVEGCHFKQRYRDFVGEELDLKGGKLVDLLARCEAAGVCCLERRQGANGHPPLLFVHNITTRTERKVVRADGGGGGRMAKLSGGSRSK